MLGRGNISHAEILILLELAIQEKLLHSTALYRGAGERRTMFYKYQPYGAQDDADLLKGNFTLK